VAIATPGAHDHWFPELTSGDPSRAQQALAEIETNAHRTVSRANVLKVLLDAKLFAEADAMSIRLILYDPIHPDPVAALAKLRVQALLGEKKLPEALSAAKA
jgi:hypothetical protein